MSSLARKLTIAIYLERLALLSPRHKNKIKAQYKCGHNIMSMVQETSYRFPPSTFAGMASSSILFCDILADPIDADGAEAYELLSSNVPRLKAFIALTSIYGFSENPDSYTK